MSWIARKARHVTATRALMLLAIAFGSLTSVAAQTETKPTIFVPAEKCPAYASLVQRYFTIRPLQTGALGCEALYDARARILASMMAYGQNTACYSYGWKASEVTSFLQGLINRNQSEKLRCQAWLASGRVCNDGRICPADTMCSAEKLCVPKPAASAPAKADDKAKR